MRVCPQLRDQHTGADGGRGLHDRIPEWRHTPQENAGPGLAEEMLSDDRQKVRPPYLHPFPVKILSAEITA